MAVSLELSIVVWSRYIALKLFWRIWENNVKEGPLFHNFHQIFHKNFKMLILIYSLSHFVPIFKKNYEELA